MPLTKQQSRLGLDVFYPIVPDLDWLARVVPLGVRTIQLRMKDMTAEDMRRQVRAAKQICAAHNCTFILNDYWKLARDEGVDFVHLGQEDLGDADIAQIRAAKLRLGVSTHDDAELETAMAAAPDYIALGPIYETKLKTMKWAPQGLDKVSLWKQRIGDIPLVGIAGLTIPRADGVLAAGAQSVSVITDFLTAPDPEARVRAWLDWADTTRGNGSG